MRGTMIGIFLSMMIPILSGADARAGLIFSDDFETTVNSRGWQVYQEISDGQWTATAGTGIEVQTSGVRVQAHSGNQYLELDSDIRNGGAGNPRLTNSAMTRTLTDLEAGTYLLEYYYQPRTNRANDNTIGVYLDTGALFTNLIDTANGVGSNGWLHRSSTFYIDQSGATRQLSFRAEGIQNSLGGFLDTVSLTRTGGVAVVSAPGGLALIGMALAGFGLAARRRRG